MGKWQRLQSGSIHSPYDEKSVRTLQLALNKRDYGLPLNRAERRAIKKRERWWK